MIIILEGINRSGKTSVARILESKYGFSMVRVCDRNRHGTLYDLRDALGYKKEGEPADNKFRLNDYYEEIVAVEVISQLPNRLNIVMDRNFISSVVYRAKDRSSKIDARVFGWWMEKIKSMSVFNVFMDVGWDEFNKRSNGNSECSSEKDYAFVRRSFDAYKMIMSNAGCDVFSIMDEGCLSIESKAKAILDAYNHHVKE